MCEKITKGTGDEQTTTDRGQQAVTCLTHRQWYHSVLISRAQFLLSYSFVSLCLSCVGFLCLFLTNDTLYCKLIVLILILLPYHFVERFRPQSLSLRSVELCGVVGRSALCGFAAALSIKYGLLSEQTDDLMKFRRPAAFIFALSFFHFTEFVFTAISNPASLSVHSFLIEQGLEYWAANAMSMVEYFAEQYFVLNQQTENMREGSSLEYYNKIIAKLSNQRWLTFSFMLGVFMVLTGEIVRKTAMLQAGASFFHLLYHRLGPDHRLVTSGLYKFCRHPAYFGWFLWQFGMQLILNTPICLITHSLVTIRFFSSRIPYEEMVLIRTFGRRYLDYMDKVKWTGVPFVRGAAVVY